MIVDDCCCWLDDDDEMQTELHAEHFFPFLQPVDWWAVGVVSYELLTGHCPFTAHEDENENYFASIIRFVVFIYLAVTWFSLWVGGCEVNEWYKFTVILIPLFMSKYSEVQYEAVSCISFNHHHGHVFVSAPFAGARHHTPAHSLRRWETSFTPSSTKTPASAWVPGESKRSWSINSLRRLTGRTLKRKRLRSPTSPVWQVTTM